MTRETAAKPDVIEAATALAPLIEEHADAAERNRRVSAPVIDALTSAAVFDMFMPRVFGGGEVDVGTGVRVMEELGRADGSTGWIAMIGATTGVVSAYFPEHVSREVYRPGVITGGVVAPRGTAVAEDDGYRVNGRWSLRAGVSTASGWRAPAWRRAMAGRTCGWRCFGHRRRRSLIRGVSRGCGGRGVMISR